ncbi:MAG: phosphatase PAP2 family protein [Chloroflexota bacterium]|nr:phosphatase PAP2 family protein [Chloroflexota bacterium]
MATRKPTSNKRETRERSDGVSWHQDARRAILNPSRGSLIRVGLAIVIVLASLVFDRQFLGWGLFATLAILVVPAGRARSFVASFGPYAAVWFIFTFLRSLADETRWAQIVNTRASAIERWIFNGELPTIQLQARFYEPNDLSWWDFYLTFIHWSYFVIPHALAVFLWWKRPSRFLQYLRAMTLTLALGLVLYFALPSNPPWMAPESVNTPGAPTVLRIMEPIAMELGGGLYQAGYKVVGESNPIAAMPSIHMAITFLLVPASYYYGRVWQVLAWIYAFSMGLALVYLGEHYIIDVVIGSLIAAYSWRAARTWVLDIFPAIRRLLSLRSPTGERRPQRRPAGSNV